MADVHVPDIPGPLANLCWHQGPTMDRCDRNAGHAGLHTWEMAAEIERLRGEVSDRNQRALNGDKAVAAMNSVHEAREQAEKDLAAERQRLADVNVKDAAKTAEINVLTAEYRTLHGEMRAERQRHAEAVEQAYREAAGRFGIEPCDGEPVEAEDIDAAWLASEAKARLT